MGRPTLPRARSALAALWIAALLTSASEAAGGKGGAKKEAGAIRDEEVAQLKCPVCELAMTEAFNLAEDKSVLEQRNEDSLIDFTDNLCQLSRREGRWLRRLDVMNAPDGRLEVKNMTDFSDCRVECRLVRKACQVALKRKEEHIVDLLRANSPVDTLKKKVCKTACAKKPAALKYERTDEEYRGDSGHAGMLQMMENRDKLREETGQVLEVMRRDEMDQMSDGDKEAQAAQDAFAEQMREAREMSGRDWKGKERDDL